MLDVKSVYKQYIFDNCKKLNVLLKFFQIFPNLPGVAATKYPTSELIRRKKAGAQLHDDENKNALPRGKNMWTGKSATYIK